MTDFVVAIDGPAGSGKSSVSRTVARRAGLEHLDTGSYYRAATLAILRAGVSPGDPAAATSAVRSSVIEPIEGLITLDGEEVEEAIRGPEVTAAVSAVSAIEEVRKAMVDAQRDWVTDHGGRAVVEGRDIGTVVFPDADVKVYLTATAEERARRRADERSEDHEVHLDAIKRRDAYDASRDASPMRPAEDSVVLDTTGLSIDQVVEQILDLIREAQSFSSP